MLDLNNLTGGPATAYVHRKPKAALTTAMTGTNNDLKIEAVDGGAAGNSLQLEIIDPSTTSTPIAVVVVGTSPAYTIQVTAAVDGASAITSTAQQVADAINSHVVAKGLVKAMVKAGDTGAGIVTALAATPLTGGSDTAVAFEMGILGGPSRVLLTTNTIEFKGQQFGTSVIKDVISGGDARVEIVLAEMLSLAILAEAYPNSVLFDDGSTKKRLEWKAMVGRDLIKVAQRWELRPYVNDAETPDPQLWVILPLAAPAAGEAAIVYDAETQQTAPFTLRCYPDSRGRRVFKGNENF